MTDVVNIVLGALCIVVGINTMVKMLWVFKCLKSRLPSGKYEVVPLAKTGWESRTNYKFVQVHSMMALTLCLLWATMYFIEGSFILSIVNLIIITIFCLHMIPWTHAYPIANTPKLAGYMINWFRISWLFGAALCYFLSFYFSIFNFQNGFIFYQIQFGAGCGWSCVFELVAYIISCWNKNKCCDKVKSSHCNCRKNNKFPEQVTKENIDRLVNGSGYQDWLNSSNPLKEQYAWHGIEIVADYYFVWLLIFTITICIAEHVVPAFITPWSTCTSYTGLNWKHGDLEIACSLGWHVFSIPMALLQFYVCWMGLTRWSHGEAPLMLRYLNWTNIYLSGFAALEMLAVTLGGRNEYAPQFQTWMYFLLTICIIFTLVFGFYLQYRLTVHLYPPDQDYNIAYPSSEDDIISLILECKSRGIKLRCVGSHHSCKAAIFNDTGDSGDSMYQNGSSPSGSGIMMSLDNYRDIISWDISNKRVTVEAGLILGTIETKKWSLMKNGLCYQINKRGWALPDLGGIIKQSVAGFTAMGCAGGTLNWDYYDSIYSIRIIDSNGDAHNFTRPIDDDHDNPDDKFWGACVNMGLFGITSQITFQCIDKYYVIGSQVTMSEKDWALKGTDKFGSKQSADGIGKLNLKAKSNDDPDSLYQCLIKNKKNVEYSAEYWRFYLWPQVATNQVVFWKGHRMIESDLKEEEYNDANVFDRNSNGDRVPHKPYNQIGSNNVESILLQSIVSVAYNFFGNMVDKTTHEINSFFVKIIKFLINEIASGDSPVMIFGDEWYKILPMDQEADDRLMPFEFTELFIDISQTQDALNACWEYFSKDNDLNHMGTFGWEFYLAGKGKEWIRPNFNQNSFRIDILWYNIKNRIPYTFYNQFWIFLIQRGIDFRPHWGKWCPFGNQPFPKKFLTKEIEQKYCGINTWGDYYKRSYGNKWDQFLQMRKEMDPHNMFLTKYWAQMLSIDPVPPKGIDIVVDTQIELHTLLKKRVSKGTNY